MIRQKSEDFFIDLYFILNAIRNILLFSGMYEMASVVFYAIYISIAALIAMIIYNSLKKPIKVSFYTWASFSLLVVLVTVPTMHGGSAWIDNGYAAISFLLTMILMISSKRIIVYEKTIMTCYKASVIQAIFAIAFSFFPNSYEYGALVLHMGNPNQTAIVLWPIFSFCFLFWAKRSHSHRVSLALWILMIGIAVLIYRTECRAILLSVIITLGLYFFTKRKNQLRPIPGILQLIIWLTPFLIPIIVITLMSVLPTNITFLGKLIFSGREQIWIKIVDAFHTHPFSSHLTESPSSHYIMQNGTEVIKNMGAHNGVLAIQWYYGLLTLLLVSVVMYARIQDAKNISRTNVNSNVTYIIILATIFSLSFEEGMLMGNVATTLILPILFIICQSEFSFENTASNTN